MKTNLKSVVIMAVGFLGLIHVTNAAPRGPLPFSAFDANNDGVISKTEFKAVRAKRQAARAAEGRQLRNAAKAPSFATFDKNGDGVISKAEFNEVRASFSRRGPGRGMGQGRGMGMGYKRMMNR